MKKKVFNVIIIVVVIGAVIGLGVSYTIAQRKLENDTSTAQSTIESPTKRLPTFNPQTTYDRSYSATIESITSDGSSLSGQLDYDGDGGSYFKGTQDDQPIEFYAQKDGTVLACQDSSCYKSTSTDEEIKSDEYTITAEELEKYKKTANYLGTESCSGGSCDLWKVTDETSTSVISISTLNNFVSQITRVDSEGQFTILYEYKDITITIPEIQEVQADIPTPINPNN